VCEKAEAIVLALLGLMAGWLAGRKNSAKFRNFKIINHTIKKFGGKMFGKSLPFRQSFSPIFHVFVT